MHNRLLSKLFRRLIVGSALLWLIQNSTNANAIEQIINPVNIPDQSIAEWLDGDSNYALFTTALRLTPLWKLLQSAENASIFIPSDESMEAEGSSFLLGRVLLAKENKERLQLTISHHILLGDDINLETPFKKTHFISYSGECLVMQVEGDRLKIAADAYLLDVVKVSNGTIFLINRLLWTPYRKNDLCIGD